MHLVQLGNGKQRKVAIVHGEELAVLAEVDSVYELASRALAVRARLTQLASSLESGMCLGYDAVYGGESPWKLLAPADVPGSPQKMLVSGTGLTHLGSARERQAMHGKPQTPETVMTDSMRMFEWGRQQGRPRPGTVGIAPEWFYKGDGSVLRAPFSALEIPSYAEDGGEEAEVAAIYITDGSGVPFRIGFAAGNEFSDHVFERRNYLNLAGSKLRMCSLGPELVIGEEFLDVPGSVSIVRNGKILWEKTIRTGEENMCHSLANIEHHHFKFAGHRQPGMMHVHFLGADALSYSDRVRLETDDAMTIQFEGFGKPLVNRIQRHAAADCPVRVQAMQ